MATAMPVEAWPDPRLERAWRENSVYLRNLALRLVSNLADAEDAVQEAFIRLISSNYDEIVDVRGWLVTTTSRICLNQLGSAPRRREVSDDVLETTETRSSQDPADRLTLDDGIQMALLVVLQRLTPAERAAFVLHDVFQFSFAEIGKIVGKPPTACRQLASRARKRVQDETAPTRFTVDLTGQHQVAERFISACNGGSLDALLELLADDVAGDVDYGGGRRLTRPLVGSLKIAKALLRRFGSQVNVQLTSHPINGNAGVVVLSDLSVIALLVLTLEAGRIAEIHAIADPLKLQFASAQLVVN